MKKKLITYKFLAKPSKAQQTIIKKSIDNARYLYNQLLHTKKVAYQEYGVSFSKNDLQSLIPSIKKSREWMKTIHSQVAQDVNLRLDNAYQKFFSGGGFPKWAKKGIYNSITFPQNCSIESKGVLSLPKLKKLRFKDTRDIDVDTSVKQVNVQYDYVLDKYFVSIVCEKHFDELPNNHTHIGLDVGVAKLVTCSNGDVYENPKFYNSSSRKYRIIQRKLARQKKFGKNWRKTLKQLQNLHRKVASQRKDYLHKLSSKLISENQVIVHENLKIKNMTKRAKEKNVKAKSGLNRSMLDVGVYSFFGMLEYKSKWYGREVIKVDPKYTSQTCSSCGHTSKENRKSQSNFTCTECGTHMNADENAAINILEKGIFHECKRGTLVRA